MKKIILVLTLVSLMFTSCRKPEKKIIGEWIEYNFNGSYKAYEITDNSISWCWYDEKGNRLESGDNKYEILSINDEVITTRYGSWHYVINKGYLYILGDKLQRAKLLNN